MDPAKRWIAEVKLLGGVGGCAPPQGCVRASKTRPRCMGTGVLWGLAASRVDVSATFIFQGRAHSINLFVCIIAISVTLNGYCLSTVP